MADVIKDKHNCTGCAACVNICPKQCITLKKDSEGFSYPHIEWDRCAGCHLCTTICHSEKEKSLINNIPEAYAAYTKDKDILQNSSSGGVFREIAAFILKSGGVIYGAAFTDAYTVKHIAVESFENICLLYGSKYLQSDIGNSYSLVKQNLETGRMVLFTGTPCQVAGLKKYLKKDYDNLVTLDIVCHGVPSPEVWQKYIQYMESLTSDKVKHINFRDKTYGWHNFSVCIDFESGDQIKEIFTENLFMKGFLADVYLRPSCYRCKYKTITRISDFTLADFWGIQQVCPEMENKNGTSLCWLNTEKSKLIWEKIKEGFVYKTVDLNEALKYNSAALYSSSMPKTRETFFQLLAISDFDKAVKATLPKQHFYQRVIRKLKKILK